MMSSNRRDYVSSSEWLTAVRNDVVWQCQLQRLQDADPNDLSIHREDAIRRIGKGTTFDFWDITHDIQLVVENVWDIAELSLPKLKIQTIGMLSMEWLDQSENKRDKNGGTGVDTNAKGVLTGKLASEEAKKYWIRLQKAGFVNADCQLLSSTTRKQAMYIADVFSDQLNIKPKWKTFESLWNINNLAQEKWKCQETGKLYPRSKEIDAIFED